MDSSELSDKLSKSSQNVRSTIKRLSCGSLKFNLSACSLEQYLKSPDYPAFLQSFITIISSNTNNTFNLENNEILLFLHQLTSINKESIYDVIRFIRYINKSQCKLSKRVIFKCKPFSLIQVIICVVSLLYMPFVCNGNIIEFTDKKNVIALQSNLNEFIVKLFYSELISLNEAEMIVQSIYLINEYHNSKAIVKLLNTKVYDTKPFLCSFNLYFLLLQKISQINAKTDSNCISNKHKSNFVVNYIQFITSKIQGDLNYIYCLSSTQGILKLLTEMHNYKESKNEILLFLKYIYNNRFKQKHLAFIYKSIKNEIVNINETQNNKFISSLKTISSQIELFNELIKQNTIDIKSLIRIDAGFVFSNISESFIDKMGFDYSPVNLGNEKRSLCLFITFRVFDISSDTYKPILVLNDISKSKDIFILYQYHDNIYFKLLDKNDKSSKSAEIDDSFNINSDFVIGSKIEAMKDMFLVINYNNPRIGRNYFTCYINNISSKKDIQTTVNFDNTNALKFKIGYHFNNKKERFCFYGIIGTIEVFGCDIDKKFCENLERNFLVYRYFINNYNEKQSDDEFDNYYSCSINEKTDMEFINKVCNQSKLKEKLISVISPNIVFNRFNKDKLEILNHSYFNNLNYSGKFEFKTVPEPENGGVFVFADGFYFLDVFTKNEGVDYILFCFEYMYSVLNNHLKTESQKDLMNCIEQTVEMKSLIGLMLCEIAENIYQLGVLKPKQKLYQSLYRKFLTLLFNINIHDISNLPYLEEFFNKIQTLPLPNINEQTSSNEANYIAGYLHQLIMYINNIETFENNENILKYYTKVINNYINLALKIDKNFPKDDYKNYSIVELKGIIQNYTNTYLYGGDNPRFGVHCKNSVLSFKRDILLKSLSVYYKEIFFLNDNFQKMKKVYKKEIIMPNQPSNKETNSNTIYNEDSIYQLNYPSTIRNYSSAEYFTPRIFLKQDMKFFSNPNFKISHPYCTNGTQMKFFCQNKPLINHNINIDRKNNLLFCDSDNNSYIKTYECDLIGFKTYFGSLSFGPKYLLFESTNTLPNNLDSEEYLFTCEKNEYELTNNKQLIIVYTEIEEIIQRRFLYMDKAIEIFLKNGKSYFFNLLSVYYCNSIMIYLKDLKEYNQTLNHSSKKITFNLITNYKQSFIDKDFKSKWLLDEIDTYQYLLYINKYSSRTYNDLNQYPIIPWPFFLINKNNSFNFRIEHKNTDLSIYPCIRKTEYPITLQIENNRKVASNKYDNSLEDNKFGFHFRLHYSTSSYVILYLARLLPYTSLQIKLQSGKFDSPNRQVNSFSELFQILFQNFDNRELIPDMFNSFEFFYNLNCAYFGNRKPDKLLVHNIMIPSNFKSPCEFVFSLRYVLNNYLKKSIHKWINMIFGDKQFLEKKGDGYYLYQKTTYAQKVNLTKKIEKYKTHLSMNDIISKVSLLKMNILCFGQSPIILFDYSHTEWKKIENQQEKQEDEFSDIARLTTDSIKCKTTIEPNSIVLHFNFTSNKDKIYIVKKVYSNEDFQPSYEITIPKTTQQNQKENIVIHIQRMKFFKKEKLGASFHTSSANISKNSKEGTTSTNVNQNVSSNSSSNFGLSHIKTNMKNYYYILHPKYSMFDLFNGEFFVTGRNYNNKIIIYKSLISNKKTTNVKDYIYKEINTHSFVSVLYQINEINFFSGHRNGKIMEWEVKVDFSKKKNDLKELNFIIKRDILSHENSMITAINYTIKHNIILTCAEDGNIFIRKYYDFELMTIISQLKPNELYNDIFISNYDLLYASFCLKKGGCGNCLDCYSLNGIKVANLIDNSPVVYSNKKSLNKRRVSIIDIKSPLERTNSSSSKRSKNSEEVNIIKTRNVWVTTYGKIIVCSGNEKLYLFNGFNLCDRMRYTPESNKNNQDEENGQKKILNFIYTEKENLMYCLYEDNEIVRYCDDSFKQGLLEREMVDMYLENKKLF